MLLLCILRKLCAKVLLGLCCPCTFQASETPDPFCNLIDGDILKHSGSTEIRCGYSTWTADA